MNKTPRLTQGLTVTLLTVLLGGGALTLSAQQEQQEPIDPVPPEQQEPIDLVPPEQQEPIDPVPPEQRETQDAGNIPVKTSEETDADDSPFEYQSSEEISEDLSVSFPVDI